ncbi:putative spermidine/putrescine transport system permease protein [Stella humosa]|uniref:Putative spermidine/putrescine transport system permease protein n=1 Tax=Stella humosa TaxID=94 RepID=A0A3N1KR21_9PROT|nr:ABC transporter permease [Stella humosa]ROP84273.1 putative spermidine/putrescine transport system permease protein [Stella humosa]BBK33786.1 ABC transporter permease [Stella humosa]
MTARRRGSRGRRAARITLYAWSGLVFLFLLLPLVVVFPISFSDSAYLQFPPPRYSLRWYREFLADPNWLDATWRSVKIGCVTAVAATILGTLLAISLVRGTYPGKGLLEQFVMAPIALPSIVYSVAAYKLFSTFQLVGSWQGIAVAHTIHALPLVVLVVGASLRTVDIATEMAAQGLGASWFTALRRITLPQIRPALVSAAFIAFISSFDELVIAMFLGGINMTLPKKMFDSILFEIDPTIAAVSVLQIALVVIVLLVIGRFGSGVRPAA